MNFDIIQTFIEEVGEWAVLQRLTGPQRIPFEVTLKAVVSGFQPQELVGGIIQGDQRVIIGQKEIAARQWPAPPRKGDRIVVGGKPLAIEGVETVNVGSVVLRYNLVARGAE